MLHPRLIYIEWTTSAIGLSVDDTDYNETRESPADLLQQAKPVAVANVMLLR